MAEGSGALLRDDPDGISELAAELDRLVNQLETDWLERRIVRQDLADRLHALRDRAGRLFGDAD